MVNMQHEKKRLRKKALAARDSIERDKKIECDRLISDTLCGLPIYEETSVILAYASYKSEVNTEPVIERALKEGKLVFCPRVSGEDMDFYRIEGLKGLKAGYRGIREPEGGESFPAAPCGLSVSLTDKQAGTQPPLMLIPLTAFDENCYRLGYGRGFYDRYMTRLSENGNTVFKLGLAYECQRIGCVPREAHDVRLDMVVTEKGIYNERT